MGAKNQSKILVTGGAGFIGSALVWALNRRGESDILIADRLGTDEKWRNLAALQYADYVDADDLLEIIDLEKEKLASIDTVFHLGACSATTERDSGYLMDNNFAYTKSLAHWALDKGARFVYASSAATYGDGSQGMNDEGTALESLRPLNMYGYSKHLFDQYALREGIAESMVGLKYFNVFGPNEDHKGDMRSVVHKAFEQIREKGEVELFKSHRPDYEDGRQMRDFLYVKDAVAMTLFLAENPAAGGLFNIGSGKAHSWIDLVEAIFKALKQEAKISFIDMPEQLREKYQYFTEAKIGKLNEMGYKSGVTPLAEAVEDYVTNYLVPGSRLGD